MNRSFEGASNIVERESSIPIDKAGFRFQLQKAKEESSGALRKFRKCGITAEAEVDMTLPYRILSGPIREWGPPGPFCWTLRLLESRSADARRGQF